MIAGVDPGLKGHAYAIGDIERLHRVGFVSGGIGRGGFVWRELALRLYDALPDARVVLVERPKIYTNSRADPDDLLELAACAGAICAVFPREVSVYSVLPAEWKGQVPKAVHNQRMLDSLTPEESALLGKGHHVDKLDAVGLYRFARRYRTT